MKVQYFGDEHDFRKYALLRKLSGEGGFKIGVCWMLTEDDEGNDGGKRDYLKDGASWNDRAPDVFNLLKNRLVDEKTGDFIKPTRDHLRMVRDLVPNAADCEDCVPQNRQERGSFHKSTKETFRDANLIFYDPDNGMEVPSCPRGRAKSVKYVYYDELAEHYMESRSLLIYQHFPRRRHEEVIAEKRQQLSKFLPGAKTWAFEARDVVFLLAAQPHHAELVETLEGELQSLIENRLYKAIHKPL